MNTNYKKFQETAKDRHAQLRKEYLAKRDTKTNASHKAWETMRRRKEAGAKLSPVVLNAVTRGWTLPSVKKLNAAHLANLTRGSYDRFMEVFDV